MKTLSRMMLAAAATSLAVAPVAAEAGTRASASAPGFGRVASGEKVAAKGSAIVLALLASGLIVLGIASASTTKDKGQSPGR